ncbi:MAG: hypothetical protein AB2L17_02685 [Lentimicrobium sp.]
MNILWIENKSKWRDEETELLLSKADAIYTLSEEVLSGSPEEIAASIFKEYAAVDLFTMNLHLLAGSYQRIDSAGIKLLKLIRLHNLRQHCVVYSFFTREQFMQLDAQNLILFSGGITYCQLPFDFLKIPYHALIEKKAPNDISPYLKAEFDLPDERHMLANWWGVLQLWKVHKALCRIDGIREDEDLSKYLSGSLKEMNSYQGLLARYLYKDRESDVEEKIKKLQLHQEKLIGESQLDIKAVLQLKEEKILEYINRDDQIKILEDAYNDSLSKRTIISVLEDLDLISEPLKVIIDSLLKTQNNTGKTINLLSEYAELGNLISEEKERLERKNRELQSEIQELAQELEKKKGFSTSQFSLSTCQKELKNKNPAIIYVDDQADEGWSFVLQQMIYGEVNESFSTITPKKDESVEFIALEVLKKYEEVHPSLILLDLRLKGEYGSTTDISKISGFQVLQIIKKHGIICPVLILSASNKIWSYTETHKYGAAAYWTKEGIEDYKDFNKSIENYLHLLDLISGLCLSTEFKFLMECKQKYRLLSQKTEPNWWEGLTWLPSNLKFPKSQVTVNRDKIFAVINESIDLIELYLHDQFQKGKTIGLNNYIPSLIITKLSIILELVHKTDTGKTEKQGNINLNEMVFDQLPLLKRPQFKLIRIRNQAVHELNCTFIDMRQYFLQLFKYLSDYNFLERSAQSEPVENTETTQLLEPYDGMKCKSVIESFHPKYSNYMFLRNPGLLLARDKIIFNLETNTHISDVEFNVGDNIEFILGINTSKTPPNYYALNAQKIN